MSKRKPSTVNIVYKNQIYRCEVSLIPSGTLDLDSKPQCRYCDRVLKLVGETQESRPDRMKVTLRWLCPKCSVLWLYTYFVPFVDRDGDTID